MSANQAEPAGQPTTSLDSHGQEPADGQPPTEPAPPDRPREPGARPAPLSRLLYP